MRKLISLIRRAPKRTSAVIAIIAAAVIIPATLFAWGPSRPTYTMASPADHVTFNSITDNPNIGDERNFVGIREKGTSNLWSDNMTVQSGKEYTVRMYVHNNAAANLNLVANNVTAKFNLPTTTGKSIQVDGFVSSSNASPSEVYDGATFNNGTDFNLAYVSGSLIYENNVSTFNLPESIFTSSGAQLGYSSMNGNIPGCIQYAGYVSFTVKPQFAATNSFTMSKMVSRHGANQWVKDYSATPGETVDYLIQYRNTGDVQQDGVTFRDTLPTGQTYVMGSTIYGNANYPNGTPASDNIANGTGINVGSYLPNGNAWSIFSAKIVDNDQLPVCGNNAQVNSAKVTTGGYSLEDTATVNVNKDCPPPPTPVYTCDALTASLVSGTEYRFNGSASASGGATIKDYTFDFGDGSNRTVTNPSGVLHTYSTNSGTYTARLTVTFNVDGSERTATSNACTVNITISKPPTPVYTCDALTAELVSGNQYRFNGKATASGGATVENYTFDFGDSTNQIVTNPSGVTHTYADKDGSYTARLSVTFRVDGAFKTVTSDACTVKITIVKPPVPVYTCDALTAELVSGNEYKFNGRATALGGATIENYTFDFGDSTNKVVTSPFDVTHTYAQKDATYTARLSVTFKVDGAFKTVTSDACTVKITIVVPPTPVYTCDALTAELVSGNEYKFNGKATASGGATVENYTFDFGDSTNQIVTNPSGVTHTYTEKDATYTARLSVTFKVDGAFKTVTSDACTVKLTVSKPPVPECKPGIPEGDARCTETPVTPTELPTTGIGTGISAFLGLGSLVTSLGYYRASRRHASMFKR